MKLQKVFTTLIDAWKWIEEQGIDMNDIPESVSIDIINDSPNYFEVTINL